MDTLIHAHVSAPPVPDYCFDHPSQRALLSESLQGFDPTTDATNLAKSIDYGLVPDKEFRQTQQKNRILRSASQAEQISAHNHYKVLDHQTLDWVKQNISQYATDIRHTFNTPGRHTVGPHRDQTREYVMIYLFEPGGRDHATVFYKEKDQPDVERPVGYFVNDYSRLDEIARIQIPVASWTFFNSRILHSVENLTALRSALQISFQEFPTDLRFDNSVFWQD